MISASEVLNSHENIKKANQYKGLILQTIQNKLKKMSLDISQKSCSVTVHNCPREMLLDIVDNVLTPAGYICDLKVEDNVVAQESGMASTGTSYTLHISLPNYPARAINYWEVNVTF